MSFTGLLQQTATVQNKSALDRYGRQIFGSSSTINCRFEKSNKTILLSNGETATIDGIIFVNNDTTVNTDDKITFGSDTYKVVNKNTVVLGNGRTHHIELEVVKWQQT